MSTSNYYNPWPKNWKFQMGDFLFISLYGSLYAMHKYLYFIDLWHVGNDGNDWGKDHGTKLMIFLTNLASSIITIKCNYNLCLWVYLSKNESFFRDWGLNRERGEEKIIEMGGNMSCLDLAMIDDSVRKPLVWYSLREGGFVPFMETLNGHEKNYFM